MDLKIKRLGGFNFKRKIWSREGKERMTNLKVRDYGLHFHKKLKLDKKRKKKAI
jgi:hypothetical protein